MEVRIDGLVNCHENRLLAGVVAFGESGISGISVRACIFLPFYDYWLMHNESVHILFIRGYIQFE